MEDDYRGGTRDQQDREDPAISPKRTRREKALEVEPIHGVLPFAGSRNPLTRSNTARRVSMAIETDANQGIPQVFHFESEAESIVALEAMLDPNLFGLEVQLPPISFWCRQARKERKHHFDLRLTYRDGYKRAVFVRNGTSLAKRRTQDEIDDIFRCIPVDFADDAIVVNADSYTRAYRDNVRRVWHLYNRPNPQADLHVEERARSTSYWLLRELIAQCDLPKAAAWQAAMRLVGRRVLGVDWHAVINVHSRVWLNA